MTWIRRIAELRTLSGKRSLGALSSEDAQRLDALERFFTQNDAIDRRSELRAELELTVEFHQSCAVLRDVSPNGMYVETDDKLPVGTRTEVRIHDRRSGDEWRFPATVARRTANGVGLSLVGIPLAMRLGHRPPVVPTRRAA
jgi:hypothetical protein